MNERLIKDVDELSALYTADRSARISIVDKINELLPRIQAAILAASDFAEVQSAQRALRICLRLRARVAGDASREFGRYISPTEL